MNTEDVVIGEVIEDVTHHQPAAPLPAVVTTTVLRPIASAAEVAVAMNEYQQTVRAVLDATDWQGTPGARGSFVKKSGWRKISKAFGLSLSIVSVEVERADDGSATRATALVRASAPNGQSQDADGYCSVDESRFSRSGGRQKLENDLRATATTRAKNRAISDLVGMGEVSAEEVAVMGGYDQPVEASWQEASRTLTVARLTDLLGESKTREYLTWLEKVGATSASVGRALDALSRILETSGVIVNSAATKDGGTNA